MGDLLIGDQVGDGVFAVLALWLGAVVCLVGDVKVEDERRVVGRIVRCSWGEWAGIHMRSKARGVTSW